MKCSKEIFFSSKKTDLRASSYILCAQKNVYKLQDDDDEMQKKANQ